MAQELVSDKLRTTLVQLDLLIMNAETLVSMYDEKYRVNTKISRKVNQKTALEAKINRDIYAVYVQNLKSIRESAYKRLEKYLAKYNAKQSKIWVMYFIEKKGIDTIAEATYYSRDNVNKIVSRMKQELIIEKGKKQ